MQVIDLSHIIEEHMPVYPGSATPVIVETSLIREAGFKETMLRLQSHTGTHIDLPSHLLETGKTADEIDIGTFFGKAIKIDCTSLKSIEKQHISEIIHVKSIPEFILLQTGWDKFWGDPGYFESYPILSVEASEFISSLPVKGVGIDAISFDAVKDENLKNHLQLMRKGIILIENLCRLKDLPEEEFLFACAPLKIKNLEGCPVRAYAVSGI